MKFETNPVEASASAPVGAAEFAELMARLGPWERRPKLAVAVSGGSDSMALALLAAAWTKKRGGVLEALTVDHGLRASSAAEAAETCRRLRRRGIASQILGAPATEPPEQGLQEWARQLRYGLLVRYCVEAGIPHLLAAHHRDDQVETLVLRLDRGSGVRGLAGMSPATLLPEARGRVRLLRPLLEIPKSRLLVTLQASGQEWFEDPFNQDPRFGRGRLRQTWPLFERIGITPQLLAADAAEAAQARSVLDRAAVDWLASAATPSPLGQVVVRMTGFEKLTPAVRAEVVRRLVGAVGGGAYPPRSERLHRFTDELSAAPSRLGRCLGGCMFRLNQGILWVTREPAAVAGALPARPGVMMWDGRFEIVLAEVPDEFQPLAVAALGAGGLAAVAPHHQRRPSPALAPRRHLATLPALWQGSRLMEAPYLSFTAPGHSALIGSVTWAPRQPLSG